MATISNTPRPGYVWDSADNVWYPIGVGAHQHTNAADTPAVIPNALVDAKGDLLTATADNTPARLAVGANGETLVADSSTSTGLRYQGSMAGGKNALINGAFDYWQRGTSFTLTAGGTYTSDRWLATRQNGAGTVTRKSFPADSNSVPNSAPNYLSFNQSTAATDYAPNIVQNIEDVRTFAGQTVTLSLYVKASKTIAISLFAYQNGGSGGTSQTGLSPTVIGNATTSWTRLSYTFAMPSVSSLTVGTSSMTQIYLQMPLSDTYTVDFSQVQLEVGSVATSFTRAGGTLQGELAACRYYYERILPNGSGTGYSGIGHYYDTTNCYTIQNWQEKRVIPTVTFSGATHFTANGSGVNRQSTAVNLDVATTWGCDYRITTSSVTLGSTAVMGIQSTSGYIEASAEL